MQTDMRQINYLYKHIAAVATSLLLALSLLPSCSEDEGGGPDIPEVEYAKLVISLGCLDNARPVYTKTLDDVTDPDKPDEPYERHIGDWWIVVLNGEGKVEQVLSNTKGDVATATGDNQNTHEVSVELQVGETYNFYAFANLPEENMTYLNDLAQGATFDIEQIVATIDATSYNTGSIANGPYFPMSSYKYSVEVEEGVTVSIPLIRLLGKVVVEITNSTNLETITVKSLTLDKFRTSGSIYLLPYDEALKKGTRNLLAKNMESSYMPIFPKTGDQETYNSLTLIASETPATISKGKTETFWCYANETNFMANETRLNNLQVTAVIDGRDDSPKDTDFDFIRRNDWLTIPLILSDVSTTIEFDMKHMPIGGLPATITIPEGLTIPQATFWTQDHGGDITITYTLNSISSLNNATIKHYGSGDSYEADDANPYTSAVLESNGDDLLINVRDNSVTGADPEKVYPWLDNNEKVFIVPTEDGTSGYFTVTAQELAKSTEARIRLTIVIEGTNTNNTVQTVIVPYTIIIKNKKEQGWEEGGN